MKLTLMAALLATCAISLPGRALAQGTPPAPTESTEPLEVRTIAETVVRRRLLAVPGV